MYCTCEFKCIWHKAKACEYLHKPSHPLKFIKTNVCLHRYEFWGVYGRKKISPPKQLSKNAELLQYYCSTLYIIIINQHYKKVRAREQSVEALKKTQYQYNVDRPNANIMLFYYSSQFSSKYTSVVSIHSNNASYYINDRVTHVASPLYVLQQNELN